MGRQRSKVLHVLSIKYNIKLFVVCSLYLGHLNVYKNSPMQSQPDQEREESLLLRKGSTQALGYAF